MQFKHYLMLAMASMMILVGRPAFAVSPDARIEDDFKQSYIYKTNLQDDDVKIQSQDGAVILSGTVSQEDHKDLAQETASGIAGVKRVDNQIEVRKEGSRERPDTWIALKVKATLWFHRSVSAMRTHVDVKDGIVTLSGNAKSDAEKELAAEFAKDIQGVKGVVNQMTVGAEPPAPQPTPTAEDKRDYKPMAMDENHNAVIDDASITAQVRIELMYHYSTSAINTAVTTENGTVTLTGIAKNQAEKDLVTKLVKDIKGVKHVDNKMTIS